MIAITAPKTTFSSYYYHVCRYKRDSRRLEDRGIHFERSLVSCTKMNGLVVPEDRDWCHVTKRDCHVVTPVVYICSQSSSFYVIDNRIPHQTHNVPSTGIWTAIRHYFSSDHR